MAYTKAFVQRAITKIQAGNLSVADAAKKFGVSRATVAKWVKGGNKTARFVSGTARGNIPTSLLALLDDNAVSKERRLKMFEAYYNA